MKKSFRTFFLIAAVLLLFFSLHAQSAECEEVEKILLTDEEVDEAPERIAGEHPVYPENARAHGVSGVVTAEIIISSEGNVDDVKIVNGIEGDYEEDFNNEVIRTAGTYKFKPAVHEGENIAVKVMVTFEFKLDESKTEPEAEKGEE